MAVPKVCGIETEYGVTLRGAADPNPVLASSMLINGYVEHHKVGWDFEDESPGRGLPSPNANDLVPSGRIQRGAARIEGSEQHRAFMPLKHRDLLAGCGLPDARRLVG